MQDTKRYFLSPRKPDFVLRGAASHTDWTKSKDLVMDGIDLPAPGTQDIEKFVPYMVWCPAHQYKITKVLLGCGKYKKLQDKVMVRENTFIEDAGDAVTRVETLVRCHFEIQKHPELFNADKGLAKCGLFSRF